ncbi:large ribosomal subunit protein eL27-like [Vicia villosa]|uniref:large ribosomal subunit protein eL27-like n=1 Tax=Vicia villosa TaxID=3911 RepID=UPI00273CD149|nr:large ribosomal subunit protein eL27-like [Vicia villosa]
MVKFLEPNKVVIVLQGRYAGKKVVIIKNFDDGTRECSYGHALVAGIKKYPNKVITHESRVKAFVKLVNYQHLMPTRYTLDVDLKEVVTNDALLSNLPIILNQTRRSSEETPSTHHYRPSIHHRRPSILPRQPSIPTNTVMID